MQAEKEKNYEIVALAVHRYKVTLSDKTEREIFIPWISTQAILAIILGMSGAFKDVVKGFFFGGNPAESKKQAITKAVDLLNITFATQLGSQLTEIVNIALTEYDNQGNIVTKGNCNMMPPEDIAVIARVILADTTEILKNVFGVGMTAKRPTRPNRNN